MANDHKIIALISLDKDPKSSVLEHIQEYSSKLEQANHLVNSFLGSIGGRLVGQIQGDFVFEFPLSQGYRLRELSHRLDSEINIQSWIGIGEDARQAEKALKDAQSDNKSIKVVVGDLSESSKEESINKSEVTQEDKQKVAQVIQKIIDNKQIIDGLQQSAPAIYEGIVSTVQSLTDMISPPKIEQPNEDKELEDQKIEELRQILNDIQRGMSHEHDNASNGTNEGESIDHHSDALHDFNEPDGIDKSDEPEQEKSSMPATDLSDEQKQKIALTFDLISQNQPIIDQIRQSNAEAAEAIDGIVNAMAEMMYKKTGKHPSTDSHQQEIESALSPKEDKPEHTPHISTPERIHRRKLVYAPGSLRQDTAQSERVKMSDGTWRHVSKEGQAPEEQ